MVAKKPTTKKAEVKPVQPTKKVSGFTAPLFDANGKSAGTVTLPEEIFKTKVNKTLMQQAIRIFLANQRQGTHSTKTRGEVQGSTRKIYRQKGTGRARHGGIRAPIFVKGGIAHGPKPRDYSLTLTKKMKKVALFSALTTKLQDGQIKFVDGLEKLEPKTRLMAGALKSLELADKKRNILFVLPKQPKGEESVLARGVKNLSGVELTAADRLNTYEVSKHHTVLMTKQAVDTLRDHFLGGNK